MQFKKFNGSTWETVQHKIYGSGTDSLTAFPAQIQASGETLTDYLISGNTVQNGTPTPEAPVGVVGCGEKTAQLFDSSTITPDALAVLYGIRSNNSYYCSDYIPIAAGSYYFQNVVGGSNQNSVVVYDGNKNGIRYEKIAGADKASGTLTFVEGDAYIRINCYYITGIDTVMINSGSTALPYEPYGYKLPISCGGVITPIYLGTQQSTRRIKKFVLDETGKYDWRRSTTRAYSWYFSPGTVNTTADTPFLCTHGATVTNISDYVYGKVYCDNTCNFGIFPDNIDTVSKLRAWLAEQNENGTPVIAWFVQDTPTTGIVNEPLNKIGDYADTITMAQAEVAIPTFDGDNTITFGTSVQPSAMSATFKGWHPVQGAKQYDGSEWR